MPRIRHHRSSRRVPPPKDSDFDHEINLVNRDDDQRSTSPSSAGPSLSENGAMASGARGRSTSIRQDEPGGEGRAQSAQPSVVVELEPRSPTQTTKPADRPKTAESEIDILYENQRGGFLCGIPLFSSKALGNLDPSPWTNSAHRASPTDTNTAQVPDPSWEWAWPEWRIQYNETTDEEGWVYSFAFSKKFSWHKARWWNSFVRRRAWARKRVKKSTRAGYLPEDPLLLNPDYFTVRPSAEMVRDRSPSRGPSRASSRAPSRLSNSRLSVSTLHSEGVSPQVVIEHADDLMGALGAARIDREKIEAVENYLTNAKEDLVGLQDRMHEIMSLFLFQASRRVLLGKLTEVYDRAVAERERLKEAAPPELERRVEHLAAALKHADEEVKRLEYWSDVKGMAEAGSSKGATDPTQGWDPAWKGVDKSGNLSWSSNLGFRGGANGIHCEPLRATCTNSRPTAPSSAKPPQSIAPSASSSFIDRLNRLPVRRHRDWGVPRPHWTPAVVLRPDTPYPHKVESRESLRRSHRILKHQYQLETRRPQCGKPGDWRTILRYLIRCSPAYVPPEEGVKISISKKALELLLSDHESNLWNIKARTKCTMTLYRPTPGHSGTTWPWDDTVEQTEKGDQDTPRKERALTDGWDTEPYVVLSGEPTAVVAAVDEIVRVSRLAIYDRTEDPSTEAITPEEQNTPSPDGTQGSPADMIKVDRLNTPSPDAGQGGAAFTKIPVHRHPAPIPTRPYKLYERVDAIPRPKEWTVSTFQQYVAAVTLGRPYGSLARHLYPGQSQSHRDTVVRILHDVFNDPAAAAAVSIPALQLALEYLVKAGSSLVRDAEALRDRAKELGLRLDTDVYNRMAMTAVQTKNLLVFQGYVAEMVQRGYQPNVRTWLLFLRIIEAEDVRRYILKAMAAKNYFSDPKVVNWVAVEMADHDIYRAIQMGQDVDVFVHRLHKLYGPDWTLHTRAANRYLDVLGRYSKLDDCKRLLQLMFASKRGKPNTISLNTIITHCKHQRKIDLAIEVLQMFEKEGYSHLADDITLHLLFEVARKTKKPHLLGAVWRYAHLTAQTTWDMRRRGITLLAGEHKMERLTDRLNGLWENPDECKMTRLEFVESLLLNCEEAHCTPEILKLKALAREQAYLSKHSVALRLRSRLLKAGDSVLKPPQTRRVESNQALPESSALSATTPPSLTAGDSAPEPLDAATETARGESDQLPPESPAPSATTLVSLTVGDGEPPEPPKAATETGRAESDQPCAIEYYFSSTHRLLEKARARSERLPKPLYVHTYDAYELQMFRAAQIWKPKTPLGDFLKAALDRDRSLHKLAHSDLSSAQIFKDGVPVEMAPIPLALERRSIQGFEMDPAPPWMQKPAQKDRTTESEGSAINGPTRREDHLSRMKGKDVKGEKPPVL
ncbi:hypothetical protein VTJ49DRAFT_1626 [Mycothermus thermophilus]|uniref:Meiotically up-regulated 65 protein n=1 Tax=Humicola insolens TaxID=85995 RepID=A0ABR3VBZ4_HUMIN